jgi:sugar lactone lactonase YvrE
VEIDKDGESIWVAERCGANSCLGSDLDPIMKFDRNGNMVRSFGKGLMIFPHGIFVDKEGNVWVTDGQDNRPRRPRGAAADSPRPPAPAEIYGHNVFKFSPDGKLLMTLGVKGGGRGVDYLWQPNDVVVGPTGEIYVAEGHASNDEANARILKFSADGKLLMEWGKKGTGPGEFDQPHALAFDSQGRLFVGDRGNNRLQVFDQHGKLLDTWHQFSRASGIFIDAHDVLYVTDSESGSIEPKRPEWKRGIRIGSARTGQITAFIPDPVENTRNTSAGEGVAADRNGVIYGAEVGPRALKRYVKK